MTTYRIPRWTIQLVRDSSLPSAERIIREPSTAAEILRPLFAGLDREQFVVLCMDGKHRVRGVNVVSVGTLTSSLVHPREVFKAAILSNSAAIILAHNHPSGDPTPSSEDDAVTRRLVNAGLLLGIPVLDHVVIGEPDAYSYTAHGRMPGATPFP